MNGGLQMEDISEEEKDGCEFLVSFAGGMAGGFLVWFLSPILTGHQEAWDGSRWYYFPSILACGVLFSLYSPRLFWVAASGILVGQMSYVCFMLQYGHVQVLSLAFLILTSLTALLSGFLVFMLQKLFMKMRGS